jgi:hypothetical protein
VRLAGRAAVTLAGLLVGSALFPAAADEIYKSVDAQGHVVYSDRPNSAAAKKTEIAVQQADPNEAARLAKERLLLQADDDQRKKQQATESRAKAQEDAARKDACKKARDRYNFLRDTGRLFTQDAEGNRSYYTDAQLEQMRADAQRTMNTACGS